MALIRWEPARELRTPRSDFDRLFGSVFDTTTFAVGPRPALRQFVPAMDIVEADGAYLITADLPGLSDADVSLEVQDGVLTISGERKDAREVKRDGYVRIERASGAFKRSLALPKGVNPEAVTARFDRGVLEIHVPKPEESKPRTIQIALGDAPSPVIESAQS